MSREDVVCVYARAARPSWRRSASREGLRARERALALAAQLDAEGAETYLSYYTDGWRGRDGFDLMLRRAEVDRFGFVAVRDAAEIPDMADLQAYGVKLLVRG